ncbi:hypothetical protein G7092_10295 [Mucilaginibacter sp. HC2]|uniref:hypothetical protein n=1 Tax=Mucilaginibacter inviolabilis TaxID=2714892 RepID=UPI00140D814C|nr:hypothetical protein [Mucilaginibacter inviolabilis]NHA04187.1 hypothetical protein [Mucilaginibacter inviolabilis]
MHFEGDNYYIIRLDFKFYQLYIIWIGNEVDEVLVNDDLKVIAFKTEVGLLRYWNDHIRGSNTEVTDYNIYKIQQWITNPYPQFDYDVFLNLWNLFTDISESTKLKFIGDVKDEIRDEVYDKLFNASNGYWANEPNPVFDDTEIDILNKVMQNGLDLLLNNISIAENEIILP